MADRARKHHNELAQFDCGSSSGYSAGSGKLSEAKKREIKEVVEKGVEANVFCLSSNCNKTILARDLNGAEFAY